MSESALALQATHKYTHAINMRKSQSSVLKAVVNDNIKNDIRFLYCRFILIIEL